MAKHNVMENIQEKAEIYASEKMNELMAKAIAQAFVDGYYNGYKDCECATPKMDCTESKTCISDMGLPSGTLWSLGYLKDEDDEVNYLPYSKAVKFGLPSKEQVEELVDNCKWLGEFSSSRLSFYGATCIGASGERISVHSDGYMQDERCVDAPYYGGGMAYFWIQDEEDGNEKNAVKISSVSDGKPCMEIVKIFSGYKLPVLIVRK